MPEDLGPGEDLFPGLQMATFLLCPHVGEETESCGLASSSYKATNPVMGAPPSRPHLTSFLPEASFTNPITLGVRLICEFGGGGGGGPTNIQPTLCLISSELSSMFHCNFK